MRICRAETPRAQTGYGIKRAGWLPGLWESSIIDQFDIARQRRKVFPGSGTLESLPGSDYALAPEATIASAVKVLDGSPTLSGMLILDEGRLLGVISRQKLHDPLPVKRTDGRFVLLDLKILLMAQSALLENAATIVSRQSELARALAAIHDLEAILQLVLEGLEELVPYEQAVVYIADKGGIKRAAEHHSKAGKRSDSHRQRQDLRRPRATGYHGSPYRPAEPKGICGRVRTGPGTLPQG